jgi:hypothetical protein
MFSMRTIGPRVLQLGDRRRKRGGGPSQRESAKGLGWAHSFVGKIESGERRWDVVEFVAVAKALKVDPLGADGGC